MILLLLRGQLWMHSISTFSIRVVLTLFDYVSCLGRGSHMAQDGAARLNLSVDKLYFLLHLLKHFRQTALLKNWLGSEQVLFGLLGVRRVVDHVQSPNNFIRLCNVHTSITVECNLQLLLITSISSSDIATWQGNLPRLLSSPEGPLRSFQASDELVICCA